MQDVYIVDAVRTAIGNFGGTLAQVRVDDMAAHVIKSLMDRHPDIDKNEIEDVIFGCANQAGEDNRNIARMALLLAELPFTIGGETVNRLCASGMASTINAVRAIAMGDGDIYISGGVEGMSRGPYVVSKPTKAFGTDAKMYDSSFGWRFINPKMQKMYGTEAMGETAENLVDMYKISREDQDKFAYRSQMKAAKAQQNGRLAEEIVPVEIPQRKADPIIFDKDEFIKPNTSLEILAKLRPAFRKEGGTVTAGNASGLNDGAAALLLMGENALKRYNKKPLARIVSSAIAGVEPRIMGIGPVYASQKALKRAGLTMDDMDIIELNEAFAAQSLACIREWGLADDDERINPNGGAIALGHPLGMSGARILQTAALELQKQQKRYALVTLCIGVGQGYATVIERV
ncbi:MAG TPA: 3-oxoadipyl-CoA thiolase [Flavobacteriales bacterium]|nr:3-oxoadipyl-CoA thiolase [Flavobacteriales bacterium]|tara:strand:+ start:73740 stop:74948 length:1209 start_codon:yes stop_codon:yes gene_type:complete